MQVGNLPAGNPQFLVPRQSIKSRGERDSVIYKHVHHGAFLRKFSSYERFSLTIDFK